MPIEFLSASDDYRMDWRKINEIIDWINRMEKVKLLPNEAGQAKFPDMLDLRGLPTRDELTQSGVAVGE